MFHEIGNVSCFTNLDTLIMKDNLITFVSNATFKGMSKLRIVYLSYNIIKHIDLNVASNTGVFDFNFRDEVTLDKSISLQVGGESSSI
jgi:Leucine-rich repeat (LRR) protein